MVVRNQIHSFIAGSRSHSLSDKIYEILSSLLCSIKDIGYVLDLVMYYSMKKIKSSGLFNHFEKLMAIIH